MEKNTNHSLQKNGTGVWLKKNMKEEEDEDEEDVEEDESIAKKKNINVLS